MAVFAVISVNPNPALGANVNSVFPNESFSLGPAIWFVSANDVTPAQICERLGIKPGGITDAIVIRNQGYFGVATNALWQWLQLKGATP
jgi:hypothetical protein